MFIGGSTITEGYNLCVTSDNLIDCGGWYDLTSTVSKLGVVRIRVHFQYFILVDAMNFLSTNAGDFFCGEINTEDLWSNWIDGDSIEININSYDVQGGEYTIDYIEYELPVPVLSAPTNVIATTANTSITLGWNAVTGATGYDIEVDGIVIDNGTSTTYMHNSLAASSQHTYKVRAKKNGTPGEWSNVVTATTTANVPILSAPTNVIATAANTSITLSWNAVTGAAGYDIYVDGTVIDNGTSTTYIHNSLISSSQHKYKVRAKKDGTLGEWSNEVTATTTANVLSAPTNVIATTANTSITIKWNAVTGATGYEIDVDGNTFNNGTSITYIHNSLIAGTQHKYKVRAVKISTPGEWSSEITATTLPVETNISFNITINAEINKEFDLVLSSQNVKNFIGRIFTITYDTNDIIGISDLCKLTHSKETSTVLKETPPISIEGTDITIIENVAGTIKFIINKPIPSGKSWSGIVNIITFNPAVGGQITLTCKVE